MSCFSSFPSTFLSSFPLPLTLGRTVARRRKKEIFRQIGEKKTDTCGIHTPQTSASPAYPAASSFPSFSSSRVVSFHSCSSSPPDGAEEGTASAPRPDHRGASSRLGRGRLLTEGMPSPSLREDPSHFCSLPFLLYTPRVSFISSDPSVTRILRRDNQTNLRGSPLVSSFFPFSRSLPRRPSAGQTRVPSASSNTPAPEVSSSSSSSSSFSSFSSPSSGFLLHRSPVRCAGHKHSESILQQFYNRLPVRKRFLKAIRKGTLIWDKGQVKIPPIAMQGYALPNKLVLPHQREFNQRLPKFKGKISQVKSPRIWFQD